MVKTCLVTGSASGIGLGVATYFYAQGLNVVLTDVNLDAAKAAQAKLDPAGERTLAVKMDVTNEGDVASAFAAVLARFSSVDVVINNAGIQVISPIDEFPLADWEKVQKINLTGSFLVAREAMRCMKKTGGGRIVFIGSIHSHEASSNKSAYVAAKHGLMGLMRSVAKEGAAHHIGANMVNPGFVKTPLVEKQIPEQAKQLGISEDEVIKTVMLGKTLTGEFTTVEEVARACFFFGTFPSLVLTGQTLLLTHGWHME
ncbi:MAG: 3-hydroxybutyrate dehydrogenase [Gammaproteobacteria bacterium CG11_big_fil_rev_8_21_14_0_20_46_22]|nr:MAG: 3-hydroxybutyrate dehydrogenase [Gammaproteobacteria bacterium CG12_big_fil_rev_8_21_14_0_65_46_12]PIR11656.1 MAG: 3-hydroxybutyrate dehydrogenase [Gammaproteobacteria bacterium CG11_big_fil_rev_8_21_14_0_20_46_22]